MELLVNDRMIQFFYPTANFRNVRRRTLELRRGRVMRVRDLRDEPLEKESIQAEPEKNRGQLLVYLWDFDKQAERMFYVESMSGLREMEASATLPMLPVAIVGDGCVMKIAHLPDPRNTYCREFNAADVGYRAIA